MGHVTPTSDCGPHNNTLNRALCLSAENIWPTAHAEYFSVNATRCFYHDILPGVLFPIPASSVLSKSKSFFAVELQTLIAFSFLFCHLQFIAKTSVGSALAMFNLTSTRHCQFTYTLHYDMSDVS